MDGLEPQTVGALLLTNLPRLQEKAGEAFFLLRIACRVMPTAAADSRIVHPSLSFCKISFPRQLRSIGRGYPQQGLPSIAHSRARGKGQPNKVTPRNIPLHGREMAEPSESRDSPLPTCGCRSASEPWFSSFGNGGCIAGIAGNSRLFFSKGDACCALRCSFRLQARFLNRGSFHFLRNGFLTVTALNCLPRTSMRSGVPSFV
jgi:hypothetical protein